MPDKIKINPYADHARRNSYPVGSGAPKTFVAADPLKPTISSTPGISTPEEVEQNSDVKTPAKKRIPLSERLKGKHGQTGAAGAGEAHDHAPDLIDPISDPSEQQIDIGLPQVSIAATPIVEETQAEEITGDKASVPNQFTEKFANLKVPSKFPATKKVDTERYNNRLSPKTRDGKGISDSADSDVAWSLRHDLSSAKSLLNLVSAVAVVPGNSPRVPVSKRIDVLTGLIVSSRDIAYTLAEKANGGEQPSDSLVGQFMSTITYAGGRHWAKTGEALPEDYTQIGLAALDTSASWVSDEILRLLSAGEAYSKIDTADLAKDALSLAASKAGWRLYDAVKDAGYGAANTTNYNERFTYNLPIGSVVKDLLGVATQIAEEFAINFPDFDLKVRARSHGIDRAAKLLAAEYIGITREKLNEASVDPLTRPAMTEGLAATWPRVLAACHRRAKTSYVEIETHAREWMSMAFLPTPKSERPTSKQTETTSETTKSADHSTQQSERG
jgi:hypothetical protein